MSAQFQVLCFGMQTVHRSLHRLPPSEPLKTLWLISLSKKMSHKKIGKDPNTCRNQDKASLFI